MAISRRGFLKAAGAGAAGLALPGWAPTVRSRELATRVLGRTGAKVTVLGLGTAPAGEKPLPVEEGARIFGEVLDRGVTYVDTARVYNKAEEMLGEILPKRRDKLFVATKVSVDTAEGAEKSLETSLRLLKIDHVDLVHIHNVGSRNIDRVLAKDGALEYLVGQKGKKTRFVGCTGHSKASNFLRLLETDQIDVVQCVMNYADRNVYNFEEKVLPAARKRRCGIVAMKVYVGIKGGFRNHRNAGVGCVTTEEWMPPAIAYALDLEGVGTALVGPFTVEQGIQNVEFAGRYEPLAAEKRSALLELGKKLVAEGLGPRYGPAD